MAKNAGTKRGKSKNDTPREEQIKDIREFSHYAYLKYKAGTNPDKIRKQIDDKITSLEGKSLEDYISFLEGEKEYYQTPSDYPYIIDKVKKAIEWQENSGIHDDDFLRKIMGLYWIRYAEKSSNPSLFDKAIECLDESLRLNPKSHDAIRLKGVALSGKKNFDAAIVCYSESLLYKDDDYLTYINFGNALAEKECLEDAVQKFETAIHLNNHDYDVHNNLGITRYRLKEYEKAIVHFTFVLKYISPKNFNALHLIGLSYYSMKDYQKAIEYYDQALEIIPDSKPVLYNKSLAITHLPDNELRDKDNHTAFFNHFVSALNVDIKNNVKLYCDFCKSAYLNPDDGSILSRLDCQQNDVEKQIEFYKNNEDHFEKKSREYQDKIRSEKAKYTKLLVRSSRMPHNRSLLFFLRKWNSYTPAIPAYDRISVGGGYFIWHEKIGIVIDPGYNFLENFYRAGGSIADIDIIILTHSHDDHTIQLEQLVSLLIKYNDEKPDAEKKKVQFFMSVGTFQKFAGIIDLSNEVFARRFTVLNVNDTVRLTNKNGEDIGNFIALPTYHYEICSHDYGVGLLFRLFSIGQSTDVKLILMTSDTGLVPLDKNAKNGAVPLTDYKDEDVIYNRYLGILNGQKVNLMLLHIGSIKEREMTARKPLLDIVKEHVKAKQNLNNLKNEEIPEEERIQKKEELEHQRDSYYPNHLGWTGVLEVVAKCNPNVAVISEWGEELKRFRCDLVRQLEEVVKHYEIWATPKIRSGFCEQSHETPRIIPGDLSLVYSILDETFLDVCSVLEKYKIDTWCPYAKIDFIPASDDNPSDLYYFAKSDGEQIDNLAKRDFFLANREDIIDCFVHYQRHQKALYFGNETGNTDNA